MEDREKALWWLAREKDRCPNCRTRTAEWDETRGGDRDAYGPEERRCRGCELLAGADEKLRKRKDIGLRGMFVTLRRRGARS